jgi:diguanylate cyclase (GGDEF)-like protein
MPGIEYRPLICVDKEEQARLAALADLQISDSGPEEMFDRIARLVKASLGFPWSYISFVELDRQIIKTRTDGVFSDGCRTTSFCSSTIASKGPLIIPDTIGDPRFCSFAQVVGSPYVRSYWGVPVTTSSGFNIGALCVLDKIPRTPSSQDIAILDDFSKLAVEYTELRAQATTDLLTGVRSRRAFFAEAKQLFVEARATCRPLCFTIFDLDHFKKINDEHGHVIGDQVLRELGSLARHQLGSDALIGRIGGEEFAVASLGTSLPWAISTAEDLRCRIADTLGQMVPNCTASFGVAELRDTDATLNNLMRRADAAVYSAKAAGRNCTRPELNSPSLVPTRLTSLIGAMDGDISPTDAREQALHYQS